MPWFRLDDKSAFHAKVVAAGNAAWGAFVRMGAWCQDHRCHDGAIPCHVAAIIASPEELKALTSVLVPGKNPLLLDAGNGTYLLNDFVPHNPAPVRKFTAAELQAKKSDAGKLGAAARWAKEAPKVRTLDDTPRAPAIAGAIATALRVPLADDGETMPPIPIPIPIERTRPSDVPALVLEAQGEPHSETRIRSAPEPQSLPGIATGPKPPRDPRSHVFGVFKGAYSKLMNAPYVVGGGPDTKAAEAIGAQAYELARGELVATGKPPDPGEVVAKAEELLKHWAGSYLALRKPVLVEQRFPLRMLQSELTALGAPATWQSEQRRERPVAAPYRRSSLAVGQIQQRAPGVPPQFDLSKEDFR